MTAQQLIESALRQLGVLASGDSASSTERDDGLIVLNQLLASWSAQALPIPYNTIETLSFSGAASYTIGPSMTWNTARPLLIKAAACIKSNNYRPMRVIMADEWVAIQDKTLAGIFADVLYYSAGYTTGVVYVWPKPATGSSLELHSLKALTALAALATAVDFPPGYERALRNALAVELAPEYGQTVTESLAALAADARTSILGLNAAVLGHPAGHAPVAALAEGE